MSDLTPFASAATQIGVADGLRAAAQIVRGMAGPVDSAQLSAALLDAASKIEPRPRVPPPIHYLDPAPPPKPPVGARATLEEAENSARRIAASLDGRMPAGWGFGLFLFSFGEAGYSTWISNASRESMVSALRELLDRWAVDEPSR